MAKKIKSKNVPVQVLDLRTGVYTDFKSIAEAAHFLIFIQKPYEEKLKIENYIKSAIL